MAEAPPIPLQAGPATKTLPSFSNALSLSLQRSADRLADGQLIYGPLTALLDECLQSDTIRKLPARLRNPLNALYKEISAITQKHFDSFLSSTPISLEPRILPQLLLPATTPTIKPASIPSTNLSANCSTTHTLPPTYATAAVSDSTAVPELLQTSRLTRKASVKTVKPSQDTRLFIRLNHNHLARAAGPFAMLTALKRHLKEDAYLIKEVQETKSGFALCTGSTKALDLLEKHTTSITNLITDCKIEKQPDWISYRITFVPRTVRVLDDQVQIQNVLVTDHILSEAIRDETNQHPTRIGQSLHSIQSGLFNTTWFVNFETSNHKLLPKILRILGTSVTAHRVITKAKTIQCTKCFQWHNERSCSRPQKCSTCGSSQHTKVDHPQKCATTTLHTCPARCLHCSGPHSADDIHCPLRPVNKVTVTKSQRLAIIQSCSSARLRAVAAAGCTKIPRTDTPMEVPSAIVQLIAPTIPKTPPQRLRTADGPPTTSAAVRFFSTATNNPFSPLSFNASHP
jgi:hypothetical protein